jgi:hypothetical protein
MKCKISMDKNAFQASECYSPTSSQARVLVVQATVAAYLTRLAVKICFLRYTQRKKKKKSIPTSYVQGQPFPCPQPRIPFFGSRVVGFSSNPSCLKYWLMHPFFYEKAICKGSTGKGLPYAAKAVPAKDYFMHLTLTIARKGR